MVSDFGPALDFIDDRDHRPHQLRFEHAAPQSDCGQLITVIANAGRTDNGHTITISLGANAGLGA